MRPELALQIQHWSAQVKELSAEQLAQVIDAAVTAGKEELVITQTTVGGPMPYRAALDGDLSSQNST